MKKNHLTIIFMRDTNRPVTFEIPVKLIIILVVVIVGAVSTYAFFIKGYYSLYRNNEQLELVIRSLRTEIATLQSSINRISNEEARETPDTQQTSPGAEEVKPSMQDTAVSSPEIVRIRDLKLELPDESGQLGFSFILDKVKDNQEILRGYVFVLLKDGTGNNVLSAFPEADFQSGDPKDYHTGDRFAIRRFKGYRGELQLLDRAAVFEILAYSDTGEPLIRLIRDIPEQQ